MPSLPSLPRLERKSPLCQAYQDWREKVHVNRRIRRMQIWWTTRSSPGTNYMKARLVSLR